MALQANSNWAGLKLRVISASILLAVLLVAEIIGGVFFTALIMLAALLMIREWDALTEHDGLGWKAAGLLYVALPCASLIWLRNEPDGLALSLFVFFIVCATDIGAFFAGRFAGGPKLAPRLSPNKTWAGLFGGMALAGIVGGTASHFTPYPATASNAMFLSMGFAVLAQLGDLFESWLKRRVGAKDSGRLIPGHGGLLDRVDGLIPTLPLFALLVWFHVA